jgi:sensor domain CHASE-containing protein
VNAVILEELIAIRKELENIQNIDINIDKQIDKIVDEKLDSLRRELDQQVNGVITPRVNDIYARMSINEHKTTQTERDIKELPKRFLRRQ